MLEATADTGLTVAYVGGAAVPDGRDRELGAGDIVLVEPYLAGTSAGEIPFERPRRLHCLGVRDTELRRYGTGEKHRRAHGLDAVGIARSLMDLAA